MLLRSSWAILPVFAAGLAHAAVLKSDALPSLAVPIDAGFKWRGRPLLGENKTWRGFFVMTASGALAAGMQDAFARRSVVLAAMEMPGCARFSPWLRGAVGGASYCLGELPNSFAKRQLGVEAGARSKRFPRLQYLVDQADSVAGSVLALVLFCRPPAEEVLATFALGTLLHVGIDRGLYMIAVKRR